MKQRLAKHSGMAYGMYIIIKSLEAHLGLGSDGPLRCWKLRAARLQQLENQEGSLSL